MNKENNNYNFNDFRQQDNNNLFSDNKNNVFVNSTTGMISVNNINNVYNHGVNSFNNSEINNDRLNAMNIENNNLTINDIDTNIDENKKWLYSFLTNKKWLLFVIILIFVFTSITVVKTFYLRDKVNGYEEFFVEIEEKEGKEAVVYLTNEKIDDNLKDVAASELINCINSSIDIKELPDSINSVVDEINDYYNKSNNYFAFKYQDIYTGFTVSYNENQKIFTASTIKAPKDIYIYEMASLGKINLGDKLTYTSGYYSDGTGTLKTKKFNTVYDVKTLVNYSIVYSDNAAHNMLMDKYGRKNMLDFWKKLGTNAIFTENTNWGVLNAHDASIYMKELYRFYLEDHVYGEELMNNFLNAQTKFIKGKNNYKVANKSGWAGSAIHDVSIIFADNPYIVVALSNLGTTDYYMSYFNKVNDLAYKLHTEYWKYKMEMCGNINQY